MADDEVDALEALEKEATEFNKVKHKHTISVLTRLNLHSRRTPR